MKREISGPTWLRPKPSVAFTRSKPYAPVAGTLRRTAPRHTEEA